MRAASLLPSATEMVHFVGAGDALVGVIHGCGYPSGVEEASALPSWSELPAVREGRAWAVDANSYFSRRAPRLPPLRRVSPDAEPGRLL